MRIKRLLPVLFGFLIFVASLALIVQLRKHAPPEPARLLPGADAFLYIDLKWMRRADIATHIPEVPHDPEYEQFIQATGFQFERDLQEAALAIHYASPLTGGETRYSEIFICNIPLQGRTLRVAILGVDTVAASNHPDAGVIRGIIERSRKLASPFGGPALLRQFYKRVPLASLAWGIFRLNSQGAQSPPDVALPLSSPATVVASVRYLRAVHFRAEAFTRDEQEAQQLTTQVNTFLSIFHSAEVAAAGQTSDPDVKRSLDSLTVEQKSDRTVLTAILPTELLRKIVAEAPKQVGPAAKKSGGQ